MVSKSDFVLDGSKFQASAVPPGAAQFNDGVRAAFASQPKWYYPGIGAEKYRAMARAGETAFPKPVLLDCAVPFSIPSREAGRSIPCRVIRPEGTPSGVLMHMHAGGWVQGDEESQDDYLKSYVDSANVVTLSIGYRRAPEHPFPAAPEDCYDVAEWLIDNAEKEFGAPLKFVGGESAGSHLAALSALHLLTHSNPTYANFSLKGLLLHYGAFDLSKLPSAFNVKTDPVLNLELIDSFLDAFLPDPKTNRKDASISPLYFDFFALPESTKLPPAIFVCGTADRLLDDNIFMSAKWQMAGGEAVVRIMPGAPHGFTLMPPGVCPGGEVMTEVMEFMKERR